MKKFDFVAIGDVVIDAFIRLKEAELHCNIDHSNCQICLPFATKIPYDSVTVVPAVGNSPNAACAAARLGLDTALVTNLGADQNGEAVLAALARNHIDSRFVTRHADKKTNYHYVLWYEDDRTILIKHEEYDYYWPEIGEPAWVYLSSLGERSVAYHQAIEKYLLDHPMVKLALQPGTFQIKMGTAQLAGLYRRTEVFFCNVAEAQKILKIETTEIKDLLAKLHDLGPKIVAITDGPKGAYVLAEDQTWFMPPYPDPRPPLQRTGAGDAFSATFTAALAVGLPPLEAVRWAPVNSMSVVQQIGAQAGLLTRQELEKYLAAAPADYAPRKI